MVSKKKARSRKRKKRHFYALNCSNRTKEEKGKGNVYKRCTSIDHDIIANMSTCHDTVCTVYTYYCSPPLTESLYELSLDSLALLIMNKPLENFTALARPFPWPSYSGLEESSSTYLCPPRRSSQEKAGQMRNAIINPNEILS